MNLFEVNDYREIVKFRVFALKHSDSRFTLDALAAKTRIQKSHISRVLNKQAHLHAEQLYVVADACRFTGEEIEYMQCLLNWQRASVTKFRSHAARILKELRRFRTGAQGAIKGDNVSVAQSESANYYSQFFLPIVHMYLCIETYAKNPDQLQERLNLSADTLNLLIDELEQMKIVVRTPTGITVLKESVHLPSSNPLSKTHQLNLHLAACSSLQRDMAQKEMFFSASFSCNQSGVGSIRQKFYDFLQEAQEISEASSGELDIFHMNFDLFQHQK